MRRAVVAVVVTMAAVLPGTAQEGASANWPQLRGPSGLGYTIERGLPLAWGGAGRENVLWQAPLPGEGHASPIVWGDRVFVCTVAWKPGVEDRARVLPDHHVTCYRASDGKLLWDTIVPPGPWLRDDFRSGPGGGYAAPTPATDGKRVYCAFGSAVLAALDFDGRMVWRQELTPFAFDVTYSCSPLVFRDTVIAFCPCRVPEDSRVVAYSCSTGKVAWQEKLPEMGFGHSTPLIISVGGSPQMLLLASGMSRSPNALRSLDPATGRLLWWCRGAGDAATPAYGGGLVYFDSGRGSEGIAVDPTGSGDVSGTHIRWTVRGLPEAISSPIIVGKRLYRLTSSGRLVCWDLATGAQLYAEPLEGISSTWASPIADPAGRLYFVNGGRSYVVQAGPEFRRLAINDLGDPGHASAAVSSGRLFIVGTKYLTCVGSRSDGKR